MVLRQNINNSLDGVHGFTERGTNCRSRDIEACTLMETSLEMVDI